MMKMMGTTMTQTTRTMTKIIMMRMTMTTKRTMAMMSSSLSQDGHEYLRDQIEDEEAVSTPKEEK